MGEKNSGWKSEECRYFNLIRVVVIYHFLLFLYGVENLNYHNNTQSYKNEISIINIKGETQQHKTNWSCLMLYDPLLGHVSLSDTKF